MVESGLAPMFLPSNRNQDLIGSATSIEDIIAALARRGCADLTFAIDSDACGKHPLAGGGFCEVYQGRLRSGTLVAIKALKVYDGADERRKKGKILKRAAWELYLWSKLRHPNILPLMGLSQFRGHLAMVSEWIHGGTLAEYLKRHPNADRISLCIDVCAGLLHIHGCDMVHGDLKAANVMISSNNVAMIADFGCARLKEMTLKFTNTTNHGMSIRWAAPELIAEDNAGVSKASDVYAFGMTVLEAMTGSVPYDGVSERRALGLLLAGEFPPRPKYGISDGLWGLLEWCWNREPAQRPTAMEIMDCLYPPRRTDELLDAGRIRVHRYANNGSQAGHDLGNDPNHESHGRRHTRHSATVYECPVCDYITTDTSEIVKHTSAAHARAKTYWIRTYSSDDSLRSDSSSNHSTSSQSNGDPSLISARSVDPVYGYRYATASNSAASQDTYAGPRLTSPRIAGFYENGDAIWDEMPTNTSVSNDHGEDSRRSFDRSYRYSETIAPSSPYSESVAGASSSSTNSGFTVRYEPYGAGRLRDVTSTTTPTCLGGSFEGSRRDSTPLYGYPRMTTPTRPNWQDSPLESVPSNPTNSSTSRMPGMDRNDWSDSFAAIPTYQDLRRGGSGRSSDRAYNYSRMTEGVGRTDTYIIAPSYSDSRHVPGRRGYERTY